MTAIVLVLIAVILAFICVALEHIADYLRDIIFELAARRKDSRK